jgi:hypothetical protein
MSVMDDKIGSGARARKGKDATESARRTGNQDGFPVER